jgi:hypothetical protein
VSAETVRDRWRRAYRAKRIERREVGKMSRDAILNGTGYLCIDQAIGEILTFRTASGTLVREIPLSDPKHVPTFDLYLPFVP